MVVGGTSASSPIIASTYALAGHPGIRQRPANYPYAHSGSLYDVTRGSNGSCGGSLAVHRAGRLGRSHRSRHAQRHRCLRVFCSCCQRLLHQRQPVLGLGGSGDGGHEHDQHRGRLGQRRGHQPGGERSPIGRDGGLEREPGDCRRSSTLTINVGSGVAIGTYPLTVTGTAGSAVHSTTVSLTVTSAAESRARRSSP